MGADIYLHLFNMRTYRERIVPAFQALSEGDDPAPLVALVKEIVTKRDNGEQPSVSEMWTKEVYEEAN